MVTLGIDLAAQDKKTAVCRITWAPKGATAEILPGHGSNDRLLELIGDPTVQKIGIDSPLGWPDPFVEAVTGHKVHKSWPPLCKSVRKKAAPYDYTEYKYRATDLLVRSTVRLRPLSVSSDRLAIPAMRAAALLSRLAEHEVPVDRAGGGKVVEVYPAATLKQWGLKPEGYKGQKGWSAREELLGQFKQKAEWLTFQGTSLAACQTSDDALDALVAALVARAWAACLCFKPTDAAEQDRARREGWIAIPRGTLADLHPGRDQRC